MVAIEKIHEIILVRVLFRLNVPGNEASTAYPLRLFHSKRSCLQQTFSFKILTGKHGGRGKNLKEGLIVYSWFFFLFPPVPFTTSCNVHV